MSSSAFAPLLCALAAACVLGACRPATPAAPPAAATDAALQPSTPESHARARAVLQQAVQAMGGEDALRGLTQVTIRYEGQAFEPTQGLTSEPPYEPYPRTGWLVLDTAGRRFSFEQQLLYPGGFDFSSRVVGIDRGGFRVEHRSQSWSLLRDGAYDQRPALAAMLPHVLLLDLLDGNGAVDFAGQRADNGQPADLLVAAAPGGGLVTLAFDASNHLLTGTRTLTEHPMFGDTPEIVRYEDYQPLGAARLPRHRVTALGARVIEDIRYATVTADQSVPQPFDPPAGYSERRSSPPTPPRLMRVGDGVHVVAGFGYQMLAVEMRDSVVLVEAPQSADYMARAMAFVREAIPNKPIRYVAVTHHHDDHAGGARQVMAEGATLVTTKGNGAYFTAMAQAPFTISPDPWSKAGKAPAVETFEGQRVFEDDSQRLELIDIGPSPHTNEMVIAWLPRQRVVFQADLVTSRTPLSDDVIVNEATRHFLSTLASRGIVPAQVTGVHMGVATFDRVTAAARAAQTSQD